MLVQLNTDHNISGDAAFSEYVSKTAAETLARFTKQITRLEVHLSDEKSEVKEGPEEKRCVLEARPAGMQPVSVRAQGGNREQVLEAALQKLVHLLESDLSKLQRG